MSKMICGNALEVLAGMDAESVHCVITSPPYWGLRDYGCPEVVFGGDGRCEHEWGEVHPAGYRSSDTNPGPLQSIATQNRQRLSSQLCRLCSAWRGQFGLEPTPEMYVSHTLEFLRAIWRVLRKDGTLWLNLGDSYYGGSAKTKEGAKQRTSVGATWEGLDHVATLKSAQHDTLKPKDLVMIPFRVALAAQAQGWYLRSVIIWHKPNPMPESVRDRPTTSHEYILLLSKSGDSQYWTHRDHDGTRARPEPNYRWVNQLTEEEVDYAPPDWKKKVTCPRCQGTKRIVVTEDVMGAEASWEDRCDFCADSRGRPKGKVQLWQRINLWQGHDYYYDADAIREPAAESSLQRYEYPRFGPDNKAYSRDAPYAVAGGDYSETEKSTGRNKRTVWTISTKPYKGPHYATFPPDLIEPMILAGTSPKVCAECGGPWERITEKKLIKQYECRHGGFHAKGTADGMVDLSKEWSPGTNEVTTLGWRPTCSCNAGTKPATVADPFCGTATVAKKCIEHGRDYVMIDIDPKSIEMAEERIAAVQISMNLT